MKLDFNAAKNPRQYIPRDFIDKYPLLGKALDDQAKTLFIMKPEYYQLLQPRALEIFEDCIDNRSYDEMQGMMVALVFVTSPQAYKGFASLARRYSVEASEIIQNVRAAEDGYPTRNMAQIACAISIWKMEEQTRKLDAGDQQTWIEFMKAENDPERTHTREEVREGIFAVLDSPAMERLFIRTEKALLVAAGIERAPRSGPRHG